MNGKHTGNSASPKWRKFLKKHLKKFAINLLKIACLFLFFYLIRGYLR